MTEFPPLRLAAVGALLLLVPADAPPYGDATIRATAGASEIVITTTDRLAGAIHSLTWGGREFIDSADHGRQLQSASNVCDRPSFTPEVFNPTEAGSRRDRSGPTSSSRLLEIHAQEQELRTLSRMAFWLAPGSDPAGTPRNTTVLSRHTVGKRVRIGHKNLPHAIEYDVTFTLPEGETAVYAQFEAVTGYMPAAFSRFLTFSGRPGAVRPLSDGPGEQPDPVILATEDGSHAMGIYSPDQPSPGFEAAGYGRFRFAAEKVTKWNCVFRVRDPKGLRPGPYAFRTFVIVGSLDDVVETMRSLCAEKERPTTDGR